MSQTLRQSASGTTSESWISYWFGGWRNRTSILLVDDMLSVTATIHHNQPFDMTANDGMTSARTV